MESLSQTLSAMITAPDEASRPDPTRCECGAYVPASWRPFPKPGEWVPRDVCDDCAQRIIERLEAERRESERAERVRDALAIVAPSKRALAMTFAAYEPRTPKQAKALAAVRDGCSVWLWGRPGCGKTHLATAAAIAAVENGMKAERWLVAELTARLREASMSDGEGRIIDRIRGASLLVLDDLGVERPTQFGLECLYRIIDARYECELRTIVTSNANPSVVARSIGGRLHSRLVGMCSVIEIDGPDHRITGGLT